MLGSSFAYNETIIVCIRARCERGPSTGGISRISPTWSDSLSLTAISVFCRITRISGFSKVSRKRIFLKRPLFQKPPFLGNEKLAQSFLALSFSDPGTSRPKARDIPAIPFSNHRKNPLHKGFFPGHSRAGVKDIQTCGSLMSKDYPAQKLSCIVCAL